MKHAKVTFEDGNHLVTSINGTDQEIRDYYIGRRFNFGDRDCGAPDRMVKCVDVEIISDKEEQHA